MDYPSVKNIKISDQIISKWQNIVNILADLINVSVVLIMKVNPPYIEVFRSNQSEGSLYHVGDRDHLAEL